MSGLDWHPLLQMTLGAEQKYLNILNKAHNTNYTNLKDALYELYSTNYQPTHLIPKQRTHLESQYVEDALSKTVSVIHLALSSGKLVDNIIDPEVWSSQNKKSQKLVQLRATKQTNSQRAGYINEMIVAETLIHAIKTQYPDKDFQVRVTNTPNVDFSVFFDSSKQIKNLKTTYKNDPESFSKALRGMEHIPFDAKSNLGFFAITETKELDEIGDQDIILKTLENTGFEKGVSISVDYDDIPKDFLDPNSPYYYSELEKGETIEVVYFSVPKNNINESVLYHLLYKKLKQGIPIFIGKTGSKIDFVLASELVQRYMKNSTRWIAYTMEDNDWTDISYSKEPEKQAKKELYKKYLERMRDIIILGGKG
jgi:hypothetical protein